MEMLLEQGDPDNPLLKVLEGIVDMLPLHGAELIEETFTLVEQHMPEVDTTEAKQRYTLWSDKF